MTQKPRRIFTHEQKADFSERSSVAVRIVEQSGKPISQIATEMGLTESALHNWVKQAQIDQAAAPNGALTIEERQELAKLRRDNKRLQMERDFLTAVASSGRESLQRGEPPQRAPLGTPPTHCLKKAAAFCFA